MHDGDVNRRVGRLRRAPAAEEWPAVNSPANLLEVHPCACGRVGVLSANWTLDTPECARWV